MFVCCVKLIIQQFGSCLFMQFLSLLTTRRLVRFKELNIWLHIELRSDLMLAYKFESCGFTVDHIEEILSFFFFDNLAQEKQI